MKRLLAIALVLLAGVALVVFATGSGDDGGYRVRAVFDNAGFAIPGMDVRVSGVVVGDIDSLDVENKKAIVVLNITDDRFHDFRTDATCKIRPQSLIGERYVDCSPTRPRPAGTPPPPQIEPLESGPGKGQYPLPNTNTSTSVDLDLINNIMRLPYRERFTIVLNEFGTALAGNGEALNASIKKSNPALKAFDDVLEILADQNRTLVRLAEDGDRVLAPLARERDSVTGFIESSGQTAQATAEESAALAENLRRFPAFLREITATMPQLQSFSESLLPLARDLDRAAPSLNAFVAGTPAFAEAGIPALKTLGDTADVGGPALERSLPLVQDLGRLTEQAKPLSQNLASLLTSFRDEGGINRLMDFAFFGAGAVNGYDQYGHYLRARLVLTQCQTYVTTESLACTANFNKDLGAVEAPPQGEGSAARATVARPAGAGDPRRRAIAPPKALLPGDDGTRRGAGAAPSTAPKPKAPDTRSARSLLDYLLGE